MKGFKILLSCFVFVLMLSSVQPVSAQCSLCSTNVETNARSGATTTKGLNNGILFLLVTPYLAAAAIGVVWYKKYRRKNVKLKMHPDKLYLN